MIKIVVEIFLKKKKKGKERDFFFCKKIKILSIILCWSGYVNHKIDNIKP